MGASLAKKPIDVRSESTQPSSPALGGRKIAPTGSTTPHDDTSGENESKESQDGDLQQLTVKEDFVSKDAYEGLVTKVISRVVKPGWEQQFRRALIDCRHTMSRFPGYAGFTVVCPHTTGQPEYVIIIKFQGLQAFKVWEESEELRAFLEVVRQYCESETVEVSHEDWFVFPIMAPKSTPRWKTILVSFLGLYPIVVLVGMFIGPLHAHWDNTPLHILVNLTLALVLNNYIAMPIMTWCFWNFLNPTSRRPKYPVFSF
ncbi:unnamed protein product [Vitrella brassicaformis CCMP3155]|uniref:ABM domain-containing protein n=2 Tax=Vitrella brassicaformis TaxID=1169539 RepID=A0A0G4F6B6_VITBC|nr:unnamed protein product [Vitrella brassicaformis CCMP3155]|mmetsp:Transcript_802/g.1757  ORF Transcript_802/g.1757 Transcript_802/m.1757 type:complete len:258 (+) Transcript_802:91-864(+)|eukprot:CEM07656.1 unnamed protein product [Vitrella brassicaformis CCMP3155]